MHLALGRSYPETRGTQRERAALGPDLRPARRRPAERRRRGRAARTGASPACRRPLDRRARGCERPAPCTPSAPPSKPATRTRWPRCLAPDVRLYSPVAFKPFAGREAVSELFWNLFEVFEDFRYVDELEGEGTHALIFRASVERQGARGPRPPRLRRRRPRHRVHRDDPPAVGADRDGRGDGARASGTWRRTPPRRWPSGVRPPRVAAARSANSSVPGDRRSKIVATIGRRPRVDPEVLARRSKRAWTSRRLNVSHGTHDRQPTRAVVSAADVGRDPRRSRSRRSPRSLEPARRDPASPWNARVDRSWTIAGRARRDDVLQLTGRPRSSRSAGTCRRDDRAALAAGRDAATTTGSAAIAPRRAISAATSALGSAVVAEDRTRRSCDGAPRTSTTISASPGAGTADASASDDESERAEQRHGGRDGTVTARRWSAARRSSRRSGPPRGTRRCSRAWSRRAWTSRG